MQFYCLERLSGYKPIITSPFWRAGASFSYHVTKQGLLRLVSHADFDSRCSPPPICVIEGSYTRYTGRDSEPA